MADLDEITSKLKQKLLVSERAALSDPSLAIFQDTVPGYTLGSTTSTTTANQELTYTQPDPLTTARTSTFGQTFLTTASTTQGYAATTSTTYSDMLPPRSETEKSGYGQALDKARNLLQAINGNPPQDPPDTQRNLQDDLIGTQTLEDLQNGHITSLYQDPEQEQESLVVTGHDYQDQVQDDDLQDAQDATWEEEDTLARAWDARQPERPSEIISEVEDLEEEQEIPEEIEEEAEVVMPRPLNNISSANFANAIYGTEPSSGKRPLLATADADWLLGNTGQTEEIVNPSQYAEQGMDPENTQADPWATMGSTWGTSDLLDTAPSTGKDPFLRTEEDTFFQESGIPTSNTQDDVMVDGTYSLQDEALVPVPEPDPEQKIRSGRRQARERRERESYRRDSSSESEPGSHQGKNPRLKRKSQGQKSSGADTGEERAELLYQESDPVELQSDPEFPGLSDHVRDINTKSSGVPVTGLDTDFLSTQQVISDTHNQIQNEMGGTTIQGDRSDGDPEVYEGKDDSDGSPEADPRNENLPTGGHDDSQHSVHSALSQRSGESRSSQHSARSLQSAASVKSGYSHHSSISVASQHSAKSQNSQKSGLSEQSQKSGLSHHSQKSGLSQRSQKSGFSQKTGSSNFLDNVDDSSGVPNFFLPRHELAQTMKTLSTSVIPNDPESARNKMFMAQQFASRFSAMSKARDTSQTEDREMTATAKHRPAPSAEQTRRIAKIFAQKFAS